MTREARPVVPWLIWKDAVQAAVLARGESIGDIREASGKLPLWWRSGETIEMAIPGLALMTRGVRLARRKP